MIRAKAGGLEIVLAGRPFAHAHDELLARLSSAPEFYRGAAASVTLGEVPSHDELQLLAATLSGAGIEWDGAYALDSTVEGLPEPLAHRDVVLSESARSLVADFAGARSDLAVRRQRGERRRERPAPTLVAVPVPERSAPEPAAPSVLYHRGTLRGGQSLANLGHIIVVGDVNPGAELVAGGDIVVFGALRGVAHAGAQGDRSARVYALVLEPTQLRIATTIAAGAERAGAPVPEEAFLADSSDRITIAPAGQPPHLKSTSTAEQA